MQTCFSLYRLLTSLLWTITPQAPCLRFFEELVLNVTQRCLVIMLQLEATSSTLGGDQSMLATTCDLLQRRCSGDSLAWLGLLRLSL